jgi:hypothetical protein
VRILVPRIGHQSAAPDDPQKEKAVAEKRKAGRPAMRAVTSKLWLDTGCQSEIVPDGA